MSSSKAVMKKYMDHVFFKFYIWMKCYSKWLWLNSVLHLYHMLMTGKCCKITYVSCYFLFYYGFCIWSDVSIKLQLLISCICILEQLFECVSLTDVLGHSCYDAGHICIFHLMLLSPHYLLHLHYQSPLLCFHRRHQ